MWCLCHVHKSLLHSNGQKIDMPLPVDDNDDTWSKRCDIAHNLCPQRVSRLQISSEIHLSKRMTISVLCNSAKFGLGNKRETGVLIFCWTIILHGWVLVRICIKVKGLVRDRNRFRVRVGLGLRLQLWICGKTSTQPLRISPLRPQILT